MHKEESKLDLPIKLEELVNFSFNFENLIKAISYLHNIDLDFSTNIKDLDKRITNLECLKSDINEIKIQAKNIQNSNDNLNRSMQAMQAKLVKMDSKINEIEKKSNGYNTQIKEQGKMLESYGKNIDHLNKVVEENIKKTNNLEEEFNKSKMELSTINEKIPQLVQKDKDLENLIQMKNQLLNSRIDENKKNIEKMNNNIIDLNSLYNNLKKEIDIKNQEFQNSITNIIENLSSGNYNGKSTNQDGSDNTGLLIKTVNDNILLKSTMEEIKNEQQNMKEFISKYKEDKENYDNNLDKNNNEIININNEITKIKNEIELFSGNESTDHNIKIRNIDTNNFVTIEAFKKIKDNVRILTSSISSLPKRDEFEKEIRKINSRLEIIELIQQGVTSGPRTMINSDLVQKEGKEGEKNSPYITQAKNLILATKDEGREKSNLRKLIINTINEEMKNINIVENPKIFEVYEMINKCKEEISKNDKSIISIRNILTMSPTQNDILIIRTDLERLNEESKKKFNEILRMLNGDDDEESEDDDDKSGLAGLCIRKKIEVLIGKYHELFSKITNIQNKNNTLSKEIKEEVKQKLKNETLKVVDEFKLKLDNFTTKFEIELKNKIDRGGLTMFEDKLNSKIKGDLKEKLDRVELKKNNNQIRRKIDSLENKISKTLVDTIIDLQMDEAPLIIKKNSKNYELCASCNQPIKKDNYCSTERSFYKNSGMSSSGINNFRNNSSVNNMKLYSNMSRTNSNFNNKKLPGIVSYTQSK